jgi:hypothetical protein
LASTADLNSCENWKSVIDMASAIIL